METMERKNQAATVKMERMEGPREGGRQRQHSAAGSRGRRAAARRSRGEVATSWAWAEDRGRRAPRVVQDQRWRKWEVKNGAEGAGD